MFVVEINSIGAEILCRMVPAAKDRFEVRDRFGTSGMASVVLAVRLVVKALDKDILRYSKIRVEADKRKTGRTSFLLSVFVGDGSGVKCGCASVCQHQLEQMITKFCTSLEIPPRAPFGVLRMTERSSD